MNPFTESTIARPLNPASNLGASHGFNNDPLIGQAFAVQARQRLSRRTSVVSVLAGLGLSLSAQALDLNTATAEQLQDLRGVGPRTAQIIVQERNRAGRFESLEDLSDRVRGIGPKRIQALQAAGLRVLGAERTRDAASRSSGLVTPTIDPDMNR